MDGNEINEVMTYATVRERKPYDRIYPRESGDLGHGFPLTRE